MRGVGANQTESKKGFFKVAQFEFGDRLCRRAHEKGRASALPFNVIKGLNQATLIRTGKP